MTELTFMDVAKLLENISSITPKDKESLGAYEMLIDRVATDVFLGKDREYIETLSSYLQAVSLADCVDEGLISLDMSIALSNNPMLAYFVDRIIKNTVGLAILEELR